MKYSTLRGTLKNDVIFASLRVSDILIALCTRGQSGSFTGTAALRLHAPSCTFGTSLVFHTHPLNNIRSRGSGYLQSQWRRSLDMEANETKWKTLFSSQEVLEHKKFLQLCHTDAKLCHISNDCFDVFQKIFLNHGRAFLMIESLVVTSPPASFAV